VWKRRKSASRMRPWIAAVTAYALALHVLLTGVAVGHAMPGGDASANSLFLICHSDGSSDPQDLPDNQPLVQSPCIFCTLAKAPCAILPTGHGVAISYVASANNITDSISSVTNLQNPASVLATTGTGSIYAGAPRTFIAGMRLAFR
jgi:hypothetical protein